MLQAAADRGGLPSGRVRGRDGAEHVAAAERRLLPLPLTGVDFLRVSFLQKRKTRRKVLVSATGVSCAIFEKRSICLLESHGPSACDPWLSRCLPIPSRHSSTKHSLQKMQKKRKYSKYRVGAERRRSIRDRGLEQRDLLVQSRRARRHRREHAPSLERGEARAASVWFCV